MVAYRAKAASIRPNRLAPETARWGAAPSEPVASGASVLVPEALPDSVAEPSESESESEPPSESLSSEPEPEPEPVANKNTSVSLNNSEN